MFATRVVWVATGCGCMVVSTSCILQLPKTTSEAALDEFKTHILTKGYFPCYNVFGGMGEMPQGTGGRNMKKLEIKSWWDGDTTIYSLETENGDVIGRYWSFEDANEAKAKEEMNMKNANGQAQVIDFEMNGVRYTNTRPGYYYKKENGKQVRIGKAEWDAAWEQSGEAERQEREAKQAEADKEAEKKFNKEKKTNKPRKSKDIAFEGCGVTLTKRQVKFIKRIPEDEFYENGLDSTLWIDVLCDTVANEFNPMSVGAMISTLREKGVIYVDKQKTNGKWSKYFGFTELGQKIAVELGLN